MSFGGDRPQRHDFGLGFLIILVFIENGFFFIHYILITVPLPQVIPDLLPYLPTSVLFLSLSLQNRQLKQSKAKQTSQSPTVKYKTHRYKGTHSHTQNPRKPQNQKP